MNVGLNKSHMQKYNERLHATTWISKNVQRYFRNPCNFLNSHFYQQNVADDQLICFRFLLIIIRILLVAT